VFQILRSQLFKEELEALVQESMKSGKQPDSLLALQQLSQIVLPNKGSWTTSFAVKPSGNIIPINDIQGVDSMNYNRTEKVLRCKTAAAYRLIDMFGWASGLRGHISVRLGQDSEHFLVNPYGLLYSEVTASTLIKSDMQGEILDPGSTSLGINKEAFSLHASIHAARPDIKAIFHLRSPSAVAVSTMKQGLMPLCQEAVVVGNSSTFEFSGSVEDQDSRDQLARALGVSNKILFLQNHGVMACGENIEEAFYNAFNTMTACETQVRALPAGLDNVKLISEEDQHSLLEASMHLPAGFESLEGKRKWRKGELEFEGLMRHLDNGGYRTGHIYREPLIKRDGKKERINEDIEVPPASSSFGYMYDDDRMGSPLEAMLEKQKKKVKSGWLTSPNVYRKEEIDEIGTPNPKKITRWVPEGSPSGTPIKIEGAHTFSPHAENPKELKQKYQSIRKDYYQETVTAGPQSRILEGITWDEAQRARDAQASGTSDTVIVVGAASKGIIQRDHRHNAVIYRTEYAANPFDSMSEEELQKYKAEVAKKGRSGEETDEVEPGPDGKLISTEERLTQVRQTQGTPEPLPERGDAPSPVQAPSPAPAQVMSSPTKSTSSGEATLDDSSPTKETAPSDRGDHESPSKGEKKKKKFRIPSFSKKKDKKK
jgi:adducin